MPSVLLVEDDPNLLHTLADNLEEQQYAVTKAATVKAAREAVVNAKFDVVVLDLMLPDGDGYSFCRELRKNGVTARVLMLTARSLEEDLLRGFDAGADDYLVKPYRLKELFARVSALSRRPGTVANEGPLRLGPWKIDLTTRTVTGAAEVSLTKKEFELLVLLHRANGAVLSRDEILEKVWGDVVVDLHTVDNFISALKKKLPGDGYAFKTVRGVGFRLER